MNLATERIIIHLNELHVDGSVIRAHQHAAGGKQGAKPQKN